MWFFGGSVTKIALGPPTFDIFLMTPEVNNSAAQRVPSTVARTILVLKYLAELDLSPKQFMVTFMSSSEPVIKYRRRLMKTGRGFEQTRSIITNFGKHSKSCEEGRAAWESLILDEVSSAIGAPFQWGEIKIHRSLFIILQASEIVNEQELARGHFPLGAYVKLALNQTHLDDVEDDLSQEGPPLHPDSNTSSQATDAGDAEEATVLSMENLVFVKPSAKDLAAHKLAKAKCTSEAARLATFLDAMAKADRSAVEGHQGLCRTHTWGPWRTSVRLSGYETALCRSNRHAPT
ncbi:uncharacterized protein MELLADRAFT_109330 [Melampsora larici-populina 98AG31]|uniref:Uncharacterized protein n=1 Tax=Melampsora larici-populina (strain 98AG31 / pathotype 3-4-7) TaxID=747676 RepID=F4RW40_MELLP|nr:uncharacterized protein MELLADRAFT_109330 [Melampsora larici-populina 98AG31]EGG03475.1 hypothetical protein MELLADRAFT_109330 [Melampsora larici-populina 98AG31]